MSDQGPCPKEETLAALAEDRLGGEERTALMAHLARCNRCFKLHAETLRALAELDQVNHPGPSLMATGRFSPRAKSTLYGALGLAIAAALVVAFGPGLFDSGPPVEGTYQTAMETLAKLDGWRIERFDLSADIDPETFDQRRLTRGAGAWVPVEDEALRRLLTRLGNRLERRPEDYEARLRLAALQLATGNLEAALVHADRLVRQGPDDPGATCLRILAEYLMAERRSDKEAQGAARRKMEALAAEFPGHPATLHNLARMMEESGGSDAARQIWQRYLDTAEESPRTRGVRKNLND